MNIFIYSDESGVFDHVHNDYFVFGGIILLGNEQKEIQNRKYAAVEHKLRKANRYPNDFEIKATTVSNKDKNKIFRSLNGCHKFGCVIDQKRILSTIWKSKKDKQRYLDYAYKIAVKRALEKLIRNGLIDEKDNNNLYFFIDEHTTATNGIYELSESMESEFKRGTYNSNYRIFYPPLFSNLDKLHVEFCDSANKKRRLVRAADIVANKLYHLAVTDQRDRISSISNFNVIYLP